MNAISFKGMAFVYMVFFEYIYRKLEAMISDNEKDVGAELRDVTLALKKDITALGDRMDQLFKDQLKWIIVAMQSLFLLFLILKLFRLL
ncbi:MAG: hypothetical protein ACJ751_22080 [Niastella sp.]|uniref:hypothetical protein n=1 Tax=Niastella sp. TaxID=1869183 RepID=UPI00389B20E2